MPLNWVRFSEQHPRWFAVLVTLKKLRTKVAFVLAFACSAEAIYFRERPLDIDEFSPWLFVAGVLILTGGAFRVAAFGCLKKKEQLATTGIYSLCRHPLYLGSILITYGFCVLLNDPSNFIVATAYFATFYSLTIAWEEVRLGQQYGEAHQRYRESTPLILPLGRFRPSPFDWTRASRQGGLAMVGFVLAAVTASEVMAELLGR